VQAFIYTYYNITCINFANKYSLASGIKDGLDWNKTLTVLQPPNLKDFLYQSCKMTSWHTWELAKHG